MSREQSKKCIRLVSIINGSRKAKDEQEHVQACLFYAVVWLRADANKHIALLVKRYNEKTGASVNVETIEKLVMLGANDT